MPENIFMPTYDIISYLWAKRDIHSCAVGGTAKNEGKKRGGGWCVIGSKCGKTQERGGGGRCRRLVSLRLP